jgi:hypothetical protein
MKKDLPFLAVCNVLFLLTGTAIGEVTQLSESVCHQSGENNGECQADNRSTPDPPHGVLNTSSTSSSGGVGGNDIISTTNTEVMKNASSHDKTSSIEATVEDFVAPEPYRCNIYMAPSSIPGAGFGIFTVRDIAKGEKILPYADAPSIPLCDEYVNGMEETDWNHVDYLWSGKGLAEYECESVSESVVTFGALCNFHTVSPMYRLKCCCAQRASDISINRYFRWGYCFMMSILCCSRFISLIFLSSFLSFFLHFSTWPTSIL